MWLQRSAPSILHLHSPDSFIPLLIRWKYLAAVSYLLTIIADITSLNKIESFKPQEKLFYCIMCDKWICNKVKHVQCTPKYLYTQATIPQFFSVVSILQCHVIHHNFIIQYYLHFVLSSCFFPLVLRLLNVLGW